MKKTIVLLGVGSTYFTRGIVESLIAKGGEWDVRLVDIDETCLEIATLLTQRLVDLYEAPVTITGSLDRTEVLPGADAVVSTIGVGGRRAWEKDVTIFRRFNIYQSTGDTYGAGGVSRALRTIPVILALAGDMSAACPDAWLVNYTNPSGILAEALGKHSRARFIGLCSGPKMWSEAVFERMGVESARACVDWVGLNHLGFAVRVWVDGHDVTEQAVEAVAEHWSVDAGWLRTLGAIPATYLRYYYHHPSVVREAGEPGHRTRGEQVKEIEAQLLRQYADPDLADRPSLLAKRGGGGYAAVAFAAMRAVARNTGERQIVQVLNRGAVDGIPADAFRLRWM